MADQVGSDPEGDNRQVKEADMKKQRVWFVLIDGRLLVNGHNGGHYKTKRAAVEKCKRMIAAGHNADVVSKQMEVFG